MHYVSDASPGIRRERRKSRRKILFHYRSPQGRPLKDKAVLDRIRALAIGPLLSLLRSTARQALKTTTILRQPGE